MKIMNGTDGGTNGDADELQPAPDARTDRLQEGEDAFWQNTEGGRWKGRQERTKITTSLSINSRIRVPPIYYHFSHLLSLPDPGWCTSAVGGGGGTPNQGSIPDHTSVDGELAPHGMEGQHTDVFMGSPRSSLYRPLIVQAFRLALPCRNRTRSASTKGIY